MLGVELLAFGGRSGKVGGLDARRGFSGRGCFSRAGDDRPFFGERGEGRGGKGRRLTNTGGGFDGRCGSENRRWSECPCGFTGRLGMGGGC